MRFPELKKKVFLAPLAGFSDIAMRMLCLKQGAGMTFTELTSADGIINKQHNLSKLLDVIPEQKDDRPLGIQIFGSDPKKIAEAGKIVEPLCDVIDLNIGCPSPKITQNECGAALLMKPEKLSKIVSALVNAVNIPVTAKIRTGAKGKVVYKQIGKTLQDAGVSMITLHARTLEQGYSGTADWNMIKELVNTVDIPVCGNGDITSPEKCKEIIDVTGCTYAMIGRAAMGNPLLFRECNEFLKKGTYAKVSDKEKVSVFFEYLELAKRYKIEFANIKGQAMKFSHGLDGASQLRRDIAKADDVASLKKIFTF